MYLISHPDVQGDRQVPERTLATYAARGWLLVEQVGDDTATRPAPELNMPNRSGSTAEWRTYAVAIGDLTIDQAFAASRDELADKYDPKPDDDGPAKATPKRTRKPASPPDDATPPPAEPPAAPVADAETTPATTEEN